MGEKAWQNIKPGDVFGRLTVVAFAGKTDNMQPAFFCDCKCGTKHYLATAHGLLTGRIKSCNKCWRIKDLAGARCPIPYKGCKENSHGLCCHDCDKKAFCKHACQSDTAPYPNGCGRDKS